MRLSVQFDGEIVRKGLEALGDAVPKIGRQRIRTIMNRIVRRMQAYPPERPGQKYKRTGRLFYSWKIEEIGQGYRVENTAKRRGRGYAGYVVGNAYGTGQAWMHKGRWLLVRDVTEEELKVLPKELEGDIVMVARRGGLEAK